MAERNLDCDICSMNSMEIKQQAFARLLGIMDELREKCPWDRKQTMESLRHLTIEETYELGEAILKNEPDEIRGEIGDLLLHMVFYSKIASENGWFDIGDALNKICDKLISRHPHIYGDVIAEDEETVKSNWEKLKLKEGSKGVLSGVPNSLPALVKASRIQDKARGVGFDWPNSEDVWAKVREEMEEFRWEAERGSDKMEAEFGDLLFSLVNFARFKGINPEDALEKTNLKFIRRFNYLEENSALDGKVLSDMTLEEMDYYWNEAKTKNL
jgi:XTP/dITP diphosphohydrolase